MCVSSVQDLLLYHCVSSAALAMLNKLDPNSLLLVSMYCIINVDFSRTHVCYDEIMLLAVT